MHRDFVFTPPAPFHSACTILVGWSSNGHVDELPVGSDARASSHSAQGFRARQPAVCTIGGVLAVGVLGHLISDDGGRGSNPGRGTGVD